MSAPCESRAAHPYPAARVAARPRWLRCAAGPVAPYARYPAYARQCQRLQDEASRSGIARPRPASSAADDRFRRRLPSRAARRTAPPRVAPAATGRATALCACPWKTRPRPATAAGAVPCHAPTSLKYRWQERRRALRGALRFLARVEMHAPDQMPGRMPRLEKILQTELGDNEFCTQGNVEFPPQGAETFCSQVFRASHRRSVGDQNFQRRVSGRATAISPSGGVAHKAVTYRAAKSRHHPMTGGSAIPTAEAPRCSKP